jgi:hypothetical protein
MEHGVCQCNPEVLQGDHHVDKRNSAEPELQSPSDTKLYALIYVSVKSLGDLQLTIIHNLNDRLHDGACERRSLNLNHYCLRVQMVGRRPLLPHPPAVST